MAAEVLDDLIHVRLHPDDAGNGVVPHHGALHPGVDNIVRLAKHVIDNLAINNRTAVLVKVGLRVGG